MNHRFFSLGEQAFATAKAAGQIHGNSTDLIHALPKGLTPEHMQAEHSQFVSGFNAASRKDRLSPPPAALNLGGMFDQQFDRIFGAT